MQSVSRITATTALDADRKELGQRVADQVFDAMRWTQVSSGVIQDVSSPDQWRHRGSEDVEADLAYLEIHRPAILAALSEYLANPSLRTRELDWLFLNLLTYAEYIATVTEIRKKLLGMDKFAKSLHPPRSEHVPSISELASRPWRTTFCAAATGLSFLIHPIVAIGVGAASVYWYMTRRQGTEQVNSVLSAMFRTYAAFNTVDLSWSHVARSLEDSRRDGAVWDASLFRLAEVRQSAA